MLNENLIDPKDIKIAKLELAIKNFKEYDENRKKYCHTLEKKIQDLQYLLDDKIAEFNEIISDNVQDNIIESFTSKISKLQEKILNQRKEINSLSDRLYAYKYDISDKQITYALSNRDREKIIKENSHLQEDNKLLRKTISDLICRLNITK